MKISSYSGINFIVINLHMFKKIILTILTFSCLTFGQEGEKRQVLAVLDFIAKGLDEMAITALSDRLRTELFRTGKFTVMG